MESFLLDSRVGATGMSMALFSFLQDISCKGNIESQPLSRTTFGGQRDMAQVRARVMKDVLFHKETYVK